MTKNRGYARWYQQPIVCFILLLNVLFLNLSSSAQQQESAPPAPHADSARADFVSRMKKFGADEITRSVATLRAGRITLKQDELIENIVKTAHKAKDYLKGGIDSAGINAGLDQLQNWYTVLGDGVFINKGTVQTSRNLSISSQLLRELIYKTELQKNKLDRYYKEVVNFRFKIDSLSSDSSLYIFPDDSAGIVKYQQKVRIAVFTLQPADSSIKKALVVVQELQTKANLLLNMFTSRFEEIELYRRELSDNTFNREFANLGDSVGFRRPFGEIISFSKAKGKLALWFYASDNVSKILALVLAILLATIFLKSLKEKLSDQALLNRDFSGQLIFRYPALSATMIMLNLLQFIFIDPPFIFNVWFWIISAVCLTIIFWNYISGHWMYMWLTMLFLFMLACADNAILQASRTERWYMLALAAAGVLAGTYFLLRRGHRKELKEKTILYFIAFVVVAELASIFTNIYGRYNLSKTLLTSGYFSLIIAILFLWTIRMINEALSHAAEVYKNPEKKLFYINFDRVGNKAPGIFYILLIVGWFILVARNFYAYKLISEPLENFLFAERTVGDYSFSIKSMLIFIMILALSVITSKIVSFFASDKSPNYMPHGKNQKVGLGSWLLLVRIGIISMGLFLAFAAAGIPMDKITIILGALSVGIGFGLQTLINNLVSGLIIAFEKPVNVGDIVEIAGKSGTMKSIGFRSSVIATWDGADVIIPNGDLMNEHLVNWTLGSSMRRVEILVGVAYGTDLEKTKKILKELLFANEKILKFPEPSINFDEFKSSAIDIKIGFWVKHFRDWSPTKSEVISSINTAFRKNDIVIPLPQQDVYLHNLDTDAIEDIKTNEEKDKPGDE